MTPSPNPRSSRSRIPSKQGVAGSHSDFDVAAAAARSAAARPTAGDGGRSAARLMCWNDVWPHHLCFLQGLLGCAVQGITSPAADGCGEERCSALWSKRPWVVARQVFDEGTRPARCTPGRCCPAVWRRRSAGGCRWRSRGVVIELLYSWLQFLLYSWLRLLVLVEWKCRLYLSCL